MHNVSIKPKAEFKTEIKAEDNADVKVEIKSDQPDLPAQDEILGLIVDYFKSSTEDKAKFEFVKGDASTIPKNQFWLMSALLL